MNCDIDIKCEEDPLSVMEIKTEPKVSFKIFIVFFFSSSILMSPCSGFRFAKRLLLSQSVHVSFFTISIHLILLFSIDFLTCSSHLYLGWHFGLIPYSWYSHACLVILLALILLIWPYHLILHASSRKHVPIKKIKALVSKKYLLQCLQKLVTRWLRW